MAAQIDRRELEASGLFDAGWYLTRNPDVQSLGMDPLEHYLWLGARLGRAPGPKFDTGRYLKENADVVRTGYNPVLHYIRYGKKEGRRAYPVPISKMDPDQTAKRQQLRSQRVRGAVAWRPSQPVILLCAHSAGEYLFGSERSFLDMLTAIEGLGYNVVVTVPSKGNSAYFEELCRRSYAVHVFRYGWWRKGEDINEPSVSEFARIIAEEKVTVVHANTIVLRDPLIAAERLGVRSLVHVRELIRHDEALLNLIGEDTETIINTLWDKADVLIANSKATSVGFEQADKMPALVYNTAEMAPLQALPKPTTEGPLKVGLISSNLAKKGVWDFVKIAKASQADPDSIRFCLIGPQTSEAKAIEDGVAAGEMPGTIEVLGYRDSPAEAIAEVDVVLSISNFHESFGRTVLEAMAAARPVLVYDCGAPPEIVEDGVSGYVVPTGDTAAIAAYLDGFAADRGKAVAMGQAAAQRAVEVFGEEAYGEQMRKAYARVLSQEPRANKLVLPARRDLTPMPREKLKIAYFSWHFPVPSETFVLNELRILRAAGHDVRVFCKQIPYPDFKPDFDITWERVRDADHLAERLTETDRNMVHSHFVYPTVTDMVWPACEKAEVDFTFIPHAQDIFRYRNDAANRIDAVSQSKFCRKVFVPSAFHRRYLAARGVPDDKMMVNPNGCDHALYQDGVVANRASRPFRRITAIHRFTEKKGLEHLIRAAKLLEQENITIALYGYGELEEAYRKIVAEEKISNVEFCGPVKGREAMLEVFRKSDLFACPSVRASDGDMDGIPTVLMEAMSAGLPVLTTDLSGIPDLVSDGVTGFVAKATPEALATRIREFYALPDAAISAVIETGSERIQKDYNSEHLVEWLLRVWAGETVDLMIVSWNNVVQMSEIIRRLYKYTSLPFHLIVCDNGSDPAALAHLQRVYGERDNFTLILNRENAFVGPGTNICLEAGQSDYAIYVCGKEGMTTNFGWEKSFVRHMNEHPKVGQCGTLCYSPSYLYGREYPKAQALWDKFRNKDFAEQNPDRTFSHIQGGFFGLRRKMIDEIGGFSEAVPHNSTDVEFSYYVESCGWELGEVPGLMALFNKTRPGLFHRIDETHSALHPPMVEDLPALDRIAARRGRHCNACGTASAAFEGTPEQATCPSCGATRRARSVHRVLAESILLYRRLPALAVNVPQSITPFWKQQFQGQVFDAKGYAALLGDKGCTTFADNRLDLVYYNDLVGPAAKSLGVDVLQAMREAARLLKPGGTLLLSGALDASALTDMGRPLGFALTGQKRYASSVSQYDWHPVLLYRKEN